MWLVVVVVLHSWVRQCWAGGYGRVLLVHAGRHHYRYYFSFLVPRRWKQVYIECFNFTQVGRNSFAMYPIPTKTASTTLPRCPHLCRTIQHILSPGSLLASLCQPPCLVPSPPLPSQSLPPQSYLPTPSPPDSQFTVPAPPPADLSR